MTFDAGGQAQSASLLLRRAGRPDVRVDTETDTRGTLDAALRPGQGLAAGRLDPGDLDQRGGEGLDVVPEREGAALGKLARSGVSWQGRAPRSVRAHTSGAMPTRP